MFGRLAWLAAALMATVASASMALAEEPGLVDRDVWVAPNVGSLGIGLEAGWRLNEQWTVRSGVNVGSLHFTYHDKDADMVSRLSLLSAGVTADFHPFANDFRLSAGARLAANSIKGDMLNLKKRVKGSGQQVTIVIDDPLTNFNITQNALQPYLGMGYQVQIDKRMSLNLDFGALYAGTPDLDVTSHADRFGFTRRQIDSEIARARRRLEVLSIVPVVQVGLNIRF
jgi:hypothetical protein